MTGCKLRPTTKQSIEVMLLRFLQENRDLLPMYDVPLVKDLSEFK